MINKTNEDQLIVAIWMVTYNHENYIAQAVESVMMQKTNFKYKLFIGEDFSSDKTREICIGIKEKYPNKIELLLQSKNTGGCKNAQDLYKICYESDAKYIALCDGDDYWIDPLKLQKQVDFFKTNKEHSFVFTPAELHNNSNNNSNNKLNKLRNKYNKFNSDNFKLDNILKLGGGFYPTSTLLFNSKILDPEGLFYELHSKCNAGDFVVAIVGSLNGKIGYIDDVTAAYRINNSSLSNMLYNNCNDCIKSVKLKYEMNITFLLYLTKKIKLKKTLNQYLFKKEEYILLSKYLDCGIILNVLNKISFKKLGFQFSIRLFLKIAYVVIFRKSALKLKNK